MASVFYYTARNAEGAFVRGALEASTKSGALASLRTRALFVTSLCAGDSAQGVLTSGFLAGPLQHHTGVAFVRSFSALVSAGVPMRRSLEVTIEQSADSRMREALRGVLSDVENGSALSAALGKRPKEFPKLFVAMVRAGEAGGVLDEVLLRLAAFMEKERATKKRLSSALTYPAIVAVTAAALVAFLLGSIVPMFGSLFAQMHVDLPPSTALLLAAGTALRSGTLWIGLGICLLCASACAARILSASRGRRWWDRRKLALPVFGTLRRKATLARLARMLGTLLKSGVGLIVALEVVAPVAGNRVYEENLHDVGRALREGDTLAEPLALSGLYGPLVVQMVRVGEETGSLDAMLLRIADYYDLDVETALNALGSALEPLLIAGLGAIVGFIVFSIFLPLYTLIGSIK
ncbi:MAG: type II secretion system F family protein [Steroidobacteraceae bacterium]